TGHGAHRRAGHVHTPCRQRPRGVLGHRRAHRRRRAGYGDRRREPDGGRAEIRCRRRTRLRALKQSFAAEAAKAAVRSMLHDVVIVGAGPVGAALALALADGDLDVVVLDARAPGETLRGDRSLALSHGARLIMERIGVWGALADTADAVTRITRIDI